MSKAISLSMQVTKGRQDRVERPYSGFPRRPELVAFSSPA